MRPRISVRALIGGLALALLSVATVAIPAQQRGRIDPVVTLSEPDLTLDRLLRRLTEVTGVLHRYHPEAKTQHVALFCRERPVAEVHRAIEHGLLWERVVRQRDGRRFYEFYPSDSLRRAAASALTQEEQVYREGLAAALALAEVDTGSPEWETLKRENPVVAVNLALERERARLRVLRSLPPSTLRQVLAGREFSLPFARLSASQQHLLRRLLSEAQAERQTPIQRVTIRLQRDAAGAPEMIDIAFSFVGEGGKLHLYTGHASLLRRFKDPGPRRSQREGRDLVALSQLHPFLVEPVPPAKEPLDPARQPPEMSAYTFALLEVHQRTGLPILTDLYPHLRADADRLPRAAIVRYPMDGRPLWRVLDGIADDRYRWEVRDGWALLRHRQWYQLRAYEARYHPAPASSERGALKPISTPCCSGDGQPSQ